MNINFYTLCWGKKYLDNLFKFALKSLLKKNNINKYFSKKKLIICGIKEELNLMKFKKEIMLLRKEGFQIETIDYKNKIIEKKQNKISIWRFLGQFQKSSIQHCIKDKAIYFAVYPDEIYSDNLLDSCLKFIFNLDCVFAPSNEIYKEDFILFKKKYLRNFSYDNKIMKEMMNKFLIKYNKKDFFNENYLSSHPSRYYYFKDNIIFYKSLHLSPTIFRPEKIRYDLETIYTLDASLSFSFKKYSILKETDGIILSLEEEADLSHEKRNYRKVRNLINLFFMRIIKGIIFCYKNRAGINPFFYLYTFKNQINHTKKITFSFRKLVYFDFYSTILFLISCLFYTTYMLLNKLRR